MFLASQSLPRSERIATLDILRGFALMGILIMNMPGFSSSFFAEADGSHLWAAASTRRRRWCARRSSRASSTAVQPAVRASASRSSFARMEARDPDHSHPVSTCAGCSCWRRSAWPHAWLIWPGDVLHTYAILGLVLVLGLRRVSDRGIVLLIAACIAYPAVAGGCCGCWSSRRR